MTKSAANATAADEAQQLTGPNIAILKAFLKHCEAKPDFKAIAYEVGIKNAPRDVKTAFGKLGLIWKNGVVCALEDADDNAATAAGPAKVTTKGAANGAGKNRKGSEEADANGAAKKAKFKAEQEADGAQEDIDGDAASA